MTKEKIALIFGTFAPLHQGHIDLIQTAKRQCDRAYVLVSGRKEDRGDQIGLNLQKRFRYIREFFADDELTKVFKVDETQMPPLSSRVDSLVGGLLTGDCLSVGPDGVGLLCQ